MDFNDPRFEFISEYVLKTFKLKPDKWSKLVGNEELKQIVLDFLEKTDNAQLIISLTSAGALQPSYTFNPSGKNKAIYFMKRDKKESVPKDNFKGSLLFGDLATTPLDQLSSLVDEVNLRFSAVKSTIRSWDYMVVNR